MDGRAFPWFDRGKVFGQTSFGHRKSNFTESRAGRATSDRPSRRDEQTHRRNKVRASTTFVLLRIQGRTLLREKVCKRACEVLKIVSSASSTCGEFGSFSLARRIMHANMRPSSRGEGEGSWVEDGGRERAGRVETVEETGLSFSRWGLLSSSKCGNSNNWLFCHESFGGASFVKRRSICKKGEI